MVQARSGLLMVAIMLLQACGNNPVGQKLADSFDAPSTPAAGTASVPSTSASSGEPSPQKPRPQPLMSTPADGASADSKDDKPATAVPSRAVVSQARPKPATPQPYRITIRLSAADPSAPAEVVTRSLREAGIEFEVERIERIQPPATLQVTPDRRGAKP